MPLKHTRRRKLSQLVADHILGNKYRDMAFAIVHAKGQTDHIRRDRRASRPGLDRGRLWSALEQAAQRLLNAKIDKRSFF